MDILTTTKNIVTDITLDDSNDRCMLLKHVFLTMQAEQLNSQLKAFKISGL